ncbi:MAG TPA: hypothetical protein VG963_06545, partial [Polyangiaceae bacterium]|nr:hypothetical protein [Polyangiaceae bacterium]
DFTRQDGHMLFVDAEGVRLDLPKSLESSRAAARGLYLGHSPEEIAASASDLLGSEMLARPDDPDYDAVARVFPPIQKVRGDTHGFVGAPDTFDKVGFTYGGRAPNFDPVVYQPSVDPIRKQGNVWHGLVGSYLPVLRFVYPDARGAWTELLAFAPLRIVNGNRRIQPVWYRVSRIERGSLQWSLHVDSYHPYPPRRADDPRRFYADLSALKEGWDDLLRHAMKVDLPEVRVADMARFSLVRAIMTRVGDFPKYGVFDKDYGGSEHDGFPDTFTVETAAMLEWGLLERAGRYIDNYFSEFVRDDGSILYRGPELGQFGRMLTVVAQYADRGGDGSLLLRHRRRIDAIAKLLLTLREEASRLPASSPAYGMISGWCEADSCLEANPSRYLQPYFSNSTEAARGFRDLGRVWARIGKSTGNAELEAWGERLIQEAARLRKDIERAMARSLLSVDGASVLPAIAGAQEPFDVAVRRDLADPQFRSYRAYNEMMYSGSLSPQQVRALVDYRSHHHDVILGVPTAYQKAELAGFLAYGYGYGLIQSDLVREALLMLYSDMAHQYTRGAWMAPETRRPLVSEDAAPYCTPAQLVAPLMTRWLLVFEDPESDTLWLGKAIPRRWLEDGKTVSVADAPTRWGRIGFAIASHIKRGEIAARLELPKSGLLAVTKLRLRAPGQARIKSVTLNGEPWTQFEPAGEIITIPSGTSGSVEVVARYGGRRF